MVYQILDLFLLDIDRVEFIDPPPMMNSNDLVSVLFLV